MRGGESILLAAYISAFFFLIPYNNLASISVETDKGQNELDPMTQNLVD